MTYKQIEASREARLWVSQIIIPAVVGGVLLMSNEKVRDRAVGLKNKVVSKFTKK